MSTYRIESIRHGSTHTGMTEEQAAKFLQLSIRTLREKARFHEPIRGAWYVLKETPIEPDPVPKERLIKCGFKEDEWLQFCDDWFTACLRIAEAFRVNVPWLRRDCQ